MEYYLKAIKNYVNFHGRATRTEFWMFTLVNTVFTAVVFLVDNMFFETGTGVYTTPTSVSIRLNGSVFTAIYVLFVFLPGLAVAVRRLHDTNHSGAFILLGLIPVFGWIALLVFYCMKSKPINNPYIMNPQLPVVPEQNPVSEPASETDSEPKSDSEV